MNLHLDLHWQEIFTWVVKPITDRLDTVLSRLETMMATMDDVRAKVAALETVQDSAIALINGISAQLRDLAATGATAAALGQLADQLDADAVKLAAAVTANTPAPPA